MTPVARHVTCPRCGKASLWSSANRYRPFCGERCRLIDLGLWASQAYRVPGAAATPADATEPRED